MDKGFEIRGDARNPFHLSVGMVVRDSDGLVAIVRKKDGAITLPRETAYSRESFEQAIERGAREELGVTVTVVRFLGSLITHFDRPDETRVEKTTIYFLCEKTGEIEREPASDEVGDVVRWLDKREAGSLLWEHGSNGNEDKVLESLK